NGTLAVRPKLMSRRAHRSAFRDRGKSRRGDRGMSHTTYRILSCDGGGIRGVITAKLLQALDPSVIKNIDLFAGTSTGSIVALGLASGVPIDTIVELYSSQNACSKIFQPYLPLAQQDRLGRAFAAGEQALIATSEVPADLGDRLHELGPV